MLRLQCTSLFFYSVYFVLQLNNQKQTHSYKEIKIVSIELNRLQICIKFYFCKTVKTRERLIDKPQKRKHASPEIRNEMLQVILMNNLIQKPSVLFQNCRKTFKFLPFDMIFFYCQKYYKKNCLHSTALRSLHFSLTFFCIGYVIDFKRIGVVKNAPRETI